MNGNKYGFTVALGRCWSNRLPVKGWNLRCSDYGEIVHHHLKVRRGEDERLFGFSIESQEFLMAVLQKLLERDIADEQDVARFEKNGLDLKNLTERERVLLKNRKEFEALIEFIVGISK